MQLSKQLEHFHSPTKHPIPIFSSLTTDHFAVSCRWTRGAGASRSPFQWARGARLLGSSTAGSPEKKMMTKISACGLERQKAKICTVTENEYRTELIYLLIIFRKQIKEQCKNEHKKMKTAASDQQKRQNVD